ncbi:hypothetical protein JKP88DRAFT_348116 [Tribonema minus]|uniref:Uncharacterized protein n=1 Tax=Tribonema minus TaxID=303371 RepID=A0A835Z5H3_9STRA|nr:hypothetical protein JKP88DRAFT_348116 [Tribonema minus]
MRPRVLVLLALLLHACSPAAPQESRENTALQDHDSDATTTVGDAGVYGSDAIDIQHDKQSEDTASGPQDSVHDEEEPNTPVGKAGTADAELEEDAELTVWQDAYEDEEAAVDAAHLEPQEETQHDDSFADGERPAGDDAAAELQSADDASAGATSLLSNSAAADAEEEGHVIAAAADDLGERGAAAAAGGEDGQQGDVRAADAAAAALDAATAAGGRGQADSELVSHDAGGGATAAAAAAAAADVHGDAGAKGTHGTIGEVGTDRASAQEPQASQARTDAHTAADEPAAAAAAATAAEAAAAAAAAAGEEIEARQQGVGGMAGAEGDAGGSCGEQEGVLRRAVAALEHALSEREEQVRGLQEGHRASLQALKDAMAQQQAAMEAERQNFVGSCQESLAHAQGDIAAQLRDAKAQLAHAREETAAVGQECELAVAEARHEARLAALEEAGSAEDVDPFDPRAQGQRDGAQPVQPAAAAVAAAAGGERHTGLTFTARTLVDDACRVTAHVWVAALDAGEAVALRVWHHRGELGALGGALERGVGSLQGTWEGVHPAVHEHAQKRAAPQQRAPAGARPACAPALPPRNSRARSALRILRPALHAAQAAAQRWYAAAYDAAVDALGAAPLLRPYAPAAVKYAALALAALLVVHALLPLALLAVRVTVAALLLPFRCTWFILTCRCLRGGASAVHHNDKHKRKTQ